MRFRLNQIDDDLWEAYCDEFPMLIGEGYDADDALQNLQDSLDLVGERADDEDINDDQ